MASGVTTGAEPRCSASHAAGKWATPADVAASRLDFSAWLRLLPKRRRQIALALASCETTSAAAKMFRVSPARISQIRELLRRSWEAYQGTPEIGTQPKPVAA
jgi:hypothetical protein